MRIHNTFHISLPEGYQDDKFSSQRAQPPPPIIIEGEPEYEVEQIIDSRLHYGKLQYRAKWTGYPPEHDKVWYPYEDFENAGIAKQQFHQKYPRKPSLDQNRGTRKRGDLGLHNTTTATRTTTTTSTNDNTKTPDTEERPGRVGNCGGTTHEPPIRSPTRVARSREQRTSSKGARCAIMDGILRRRVPGALQRQGSLGIVSPRPISVYAISTGIAPEQKSAEETPGAKRDMVRMLRRQMLRTCAREDQSGVVPPGKRQEETPLLMALKKPRAGTTKEMRGRENTAGEGGERNNSTRRRSPTKADPGTVGRKRTIPKKQGRLPTEGSEPTSPDTPPPGRRPRTSQDGGRIGIQPRKVEKRGGRSKERKPEARATEPRAKERVEKSWAEVARFGQLASRDRC